MLLILFGSCTLATSCEELTHWKRPWCWEGLGAGGEGDDRGWDGWMASPTRWAWVWVNSGSWWWTGRPGVPWFMGLQRVRHDWVTELNWSHLCICNSFVSVAASSPHHPPATEVVNFFPVNPLRWNPWFEWTWDRGILATLSCLQNTSTGFPSNESNSASWLGVILSPQWCSAPSGHILLLSWLEKGSATGI